jgi:nitrous oxide reductase accessory protein NosL
MRDRGLLLALALGLALSGCAGNGPPAIRAGNPCVGCGMSITDLGFACERRIARGWKQYDSIECLLRDADADSGHAYLADYDTHTLHDADSMWVVRGSFPSPMGGGYAAFLTRRAADDIAARTEGRVSRLQAFAAAGSAP